ncbi:MAG TPA: hypothetical protein VKY39_04205 [Aggregatilineales bacterium]|nr:hypothetical protein [Aggregatilineales bacterium]
MRIRVLTIMLLIAALLAACGGAAGEASPPEQTARQMMQADGLGDAEITGVVEGDPAVRGADELYCVATDATTQNGELPYLLVVWQSGGQWQAQQLMEGYYEWDLQGCPR